MNTFTKAVAVCMLLSACRADTIRFEIKGVSVEDGISGRAVACEGLGFLSAAGTPPLPFMEKEIPLRGMEVTSVEIDPGPSVKLLDGHPLYLERTPFTEGRESDYAPPSFNTSEAYPVRMLAWSVISSRRGDAVVVSIVPFRYFHEKGILLVHTGISVRVGMKVKTEPLVSKALSSPLQQGGFTYLVITSDDLYSSCHGKLNEFLASKARHGYTTNCVTTGEIASAYEGRNISEKIRRFLQDAHRDWGTEYLLIAGDIDHVPVNPLYTYAGGYTHEIPSDFYYYGCLDGDYDFNGNGVYGEYKIDGAGGGLCDAYPEILVGRVSVGTASGLTNAINKMLSADASTPVRGHLFVGEIMPEMNYYSSKFMEEIINGVSANDMRGFLGYPISGGLAQMSKLYDVPGTNFTQDQGLDAVGSPVATITHFGHGSRTFLMRKQYNDSTASGMTNFPGSILVSLACSAGAMEPGLPSVAGHLLSAESGARMCLMNTRLGWYTYSGWHLTPVLIRRFWDNLLRQRSLTAGESVAQAKESSVSSFQTDSVSLYSAQSLNLFGDPAHIPFREAIPEPPVLSGDDIFITQTSVVFSVDISPRGMFNPDRIFLVTKKNGSPVTSLLDNAGTVFTAEIQKQDLDIMQNYTFSAASYHGAESTLSGTVDTEGIYNFSHSRLGSVIGHPPPYQISVSAEPMYAGGVKVFHRTSGDWLSSDLSREGDSFTGSISPSVTNGGSFSYFVLPDGDHVEFVTNVITCSVAYPEASFSVSDKTASATNFTTGFFSVRNTGALPMTWRTRLSYEEDFGLPTAWQGGFAMDGAMTVAGEAFLPRISPTPESVFSAEYSSQDGLGVSFIHARTNSFTLPPGSGRVDIALSGVIDGKFLLPCRMLVSGIGRISLLSVSDVKTPAGLAFSAARDRDAVAGPHGAVRVYYGAFGGRMRMKAEKIRVGIVSGDWMNSETSFLFRAYGP